MGTSPHPTNTIYESNQMPSSMTRRRRREKPLDRLNRAIRSNVQQAAAELVMAPDPGVVRQVEREILRYSNPWCPGFPDAPLPSHRHDLQIEFARRRLQDFRGTAPDDLARELQATPDSQGPSRGPYRIGDPLPGRPTYPETFQAFKSVRKRRLQSRI